MQLKASRLVVLFAIGAVLGTVGDMMHVAGGVLGYPGATLLGEKLWVPLLMGASTLALVLGHASWRTDWPLPLPTALRSRSRADEDVSPRRALVGGAVFLAAWAATALFWRTPNALAVGLVLAYPLWPGALRVRSLLFALSVAAIGPGIEATLSFVGGFSYFTGGLFLGVPVWLPALYLHAAMALSNIEQCWPVATARAALPAASSPAAS